MLMQRPIKLRSTDSLRFSPSYKGNFLLICPEDKSISSSYSCRVELSWEWDTEFCRNWDLIGFHCNPVNIKQVAHFFNYVEGKIGLKKKSIIRPVEGFPKALVVKIAPYWISHKAAMSLFSLFLRASCLYYSDLDFWKAIDAYELAAEVKDAIKWFMAGNTKFLFERWTRSYDDEGFVAQFRLLSQSQIAQNLGKPTDKSLYES